MGAPPRDVASPTSYTSLSAPRSYFARAIAMLHIDAIIRSERSTMPTHGINLV
jgi:hypothetical protein